MGDSGGRDLYGNRSDHQRAFVSKDSRAILAPGSFIGTHAGEPPCGIAISPIGYEPRRSTNRSMAACEAHDSEALEVVEHVISCFVACQVGFAAGSLRLQ